MNDNNKQTGRSSRSKLVKSHFWTIICLILMCSGCGTTPTIKLSSTQLEAINHNRRGLKAVAKGDLERAREEFTSALRLHRSIDNTDGILTALLNLSRTCRSSGDIAQARNYLEHAVAIAPAESPLMGEIAYEQARIYFLAGNLTEAHKWLSRSLSAKGETNQGVCMNLLARILLKEGNLDEATKSAEQALDLNHTQGLKKEEANSLRILAEIATSRKQGANAEQFFRQALALDKELGDSKKIANDLRGLAAQAMAENQSDKGLDYYRRASIVSINSGDLEAASADLEKMATIHESKGNKIETERLLQERQKLLEKSIRN